MDNRLTRAEQRFLERAAEAQEQGVTLEQYYRASGLSTGWLYNIRRQPKASTGPKIDQQVNGSIAIT